MTNEKSRRAFTLVELLVVIGIIALLISILLPALGKARESANTIKCAANMHSIGLGMAIYLAENKSVYPASYIYNGMQYIPGVSETPVNDYGGYVQWSGYFYSNKTNNGASTSYTSLSGWDMFRCPSIDQGGLPASNTFAANLSTGQKVEEAAPGQLSIPWNGCDLQAPRLAYTVNEALCPRNKFLVGFQSAIRVYQFVHANQVRSPSDVILATEFVQDWRIPQEQNPCTSPTVSFSHRPVSGFVPMSGSAINMDQLPAATGATASYRRAVVSDLQHDPSTGGAVVGGTVVTTLDWVGHNHGSKRMDGTGRSAKTSNFLYVDGHVMTKSLQATLAPRFEWGDTFYSLNPNGDLQN